MFLTFAHLEKADTFTYICLYFRQLTIFAKKKFKKSKKQIVVKHTFALLNHVKRMLLVKQKQTQKTKSEAANFGLFFCPCTSGAMNELI